jgi:hypothetical protein
MTSVMVIARIDHTGLISTGAPVPGARFDSIAA